MAGFIYIMSNPAYRKGLIKIGKSDRDPIEYRKYELETTGVPARFHVEYYGYIDDHHRVERLLHEKFAHVRESQQREFFDVGVEDVVSAIRQIATIKYEHVGYVVAEPSRATKPRVHDQRFMTRCANCRMDYLHRYLVRKYGVETESFIQCLLCHTLTDKQVSTS